MTKASGTVVGAERAVVFGHPVGAGWIAVSNGFVTATGSGSPPRAPDRVVPVLVPGFVDMHVHGGGGASFLTEDLDEIYRAASFHRQHGTTSCIASLVSCRRTELLSAVTLLSEAVARGVLAGTHLEGPWVSTGRAGAHDKSVLQSPSRDAAAEVLAAGRGTIRMVTIAPELAGAMETIEQLVGAGVVVAVGHTDATYEEVRRAVQAGARVATHLFNAMPSLHHRDPGPVAALIEDERVTVELIADGVHVHPAMVDLALRSVGPERVAFITDAIAGAGLPDGRHPLGSQVVEVVEGRACLAGTDTLAGSTLTMDAVFRAAVTHSCLETAASVTSTVPARAMGLDDVGLLAPGRRANAVALDDELELLDVLVGGEWVR